MSISRSFVGGPILWPIRNLGLSRNSWERRYPNRKVSGGRPRLLVIVIFLSSFLVHQLSFSEVPLCWCRRLLDHHSHQHFNTTNCTGISLPLQPSFSLWNLAMSNHNELLSCVHSSTTPALHYVSYNIANVIIWTIIYPHHNHNLLVISSPQHQHFSEEIKCHFFLDLGLSSTQMFNPVNLTNGCVS